MKQSLTLWKTSLLLFYGGMLALLFILFAQPTDPLQLLHASFYFSQPMNPLAVSSHLAVSAFWFAFAISLLGFTGMALYARKKKSNTKNLKAPLYQYDSPDKGEENWIFI